MDTGSQGHLTQADTQAAPGPAISIQRTHSPQDISNLEKRGSMEHSHLQVSKRLSQDKGSRRDLWDSGAKLSQWIGTPAGEIPFHCKKQIPIVRALQIRDEMPWVAVSSSSLGIYRTVFLLFCFVFNIYLLIYLCGCTVSWLQYAGSLIAACGIFSCSMRDLVLIPGMEPGPPPLGTRSLSPWTTREVPGLF